MEAEPAVDGSLRVQLVQDAAMEVEVPSVVPADASMGGPLHPLVQEEDKFTGTYTWVIKSLNSALDKEYSECFDLGTYRWRMLVFPRGNNQRKSHLAVYLDAPEATVLPPHMCPRATFTIYVVNQLNESKTWSKEAHHVFAQPEGDWGFSETITLEELYDPRLGFSANNQLVVRVKVAVLKDDAHNVRKETGFVGLKNQGATCYMNSLLQYLYNLPFFRKAVYGIPTLETDDMSNNMPLALQSLFFKLQYSKSTVATKDLTKSFGWTSADAFMQHDVQELNRVLCEKLEEKMKGTRVDKVINELFEGHMVNYIRCLHVDYCSKRKESFMDLQLDVKGCRNIYESFDRYTDLEVMNGANQYMAEGYGLQDAEKGVLFESFPPVLQLQLKRFEYDFQRDVMVKINDRYEFPEELDLDRENRKYLVASARDGEVRNLYLLHSVLVHSGGVHGGHYFAFVRPDGRTWLRFDDERVTKELVAKAMDEQYGDDDPQVGGLGGGLHGSGLYGGAGGLGGGGGGLRFSKQSNAYMLVYVRKDDWERVMCPVYKDALMPSLLSRFEAELLDKETRQREKREAHMYVSIKVATDADIRNQIASGHRSFDLVDHEVLERDKGAFRVHKYMKLGEFKALVEQRLGVPVAKQRFWVWARRPNATYRVQVTIDNVPDDMQLLDVREFKEQGQSNSKNALMDVRLYLETPSSPDGALFQRRGVPGLQTSDADVFLFIKKYRPDREELSYVGRVYLPVAVMVKQALANLGKLAGFPEEVELELYEEVKSEPELMIPAIKRKQSLHDAKLQDGDIVVIQPRLMAEEAAQLRLPSIERYLRYVQQRRLVLFKPLLPPPGPAQQPQSGGGLAGGRETPVPSSSPAPLAGSFVLELRQDMTYEEVTQALADRLNMLPVDQGGTMLRLTQHSPYTHAPQRHPLKWRTVNTLAAMLAQGSMLGSGLHRHGSAPQAAGTSGAHPHPNDVLYYEVLDMPLEQLEQLKTLKVYFHKESGECASEHTVRLKKDALVAQLLAEVSMQLGEADEGRALRLLETHSGKVYKMFSLNDEVGLLDDTYWQLRVEVVPPDEVGLEFTPALDGQHLLRCYHSAQDKSPQPPINSTFVGPPTATASNQLPTVTDALRTATGTLPGLNHLNHPVQPPLHPLAPAALSPTTRPLLMDTSQPALPREAPNSPSVSQQQPQEQQEQQGLGHQGLGQQGPGVPTLAGGSFTSGGTALGSLCIFGEPLLVRCGPNDTLQDVLARIQAKLGLPEEELAKWRFALISARGPPSEPLSRADSVGARAARLAPLAATVALGDAPYLAMEHEDLKPRRPAASNTHRLTYERPVKIYT